MNSLVDRHHVILVAVVVLIIILISVGFIVAKEGQMRRETFPQVRPANPVVTEEQFRCETPEDNDAPCPFGCVRYGMPFNNCVTQKYYDSCFKYHTRECAICLSSETKIETESGPVDVTKLKMGMLVWTVNKSGQRELQPIIKLSSVAVGSGHKMVHLVLSDGRYVDVSPNHPSADGRLAGDLRVGEKYDGAEIMSVELIDYKDTRTYDLLPAGDTGFYFANGIIMRSTLK